MNYKLFDRFDVNFMPRQNGQVTPKPSLVAKKT